MRKPILICVGFVALLVACGSGSGGGSESCNPATCKTSAKTYDACTKGEMIIYKYGGQTCTVANQNDTAGLNACVAKIDAYCKP